MSRRRTNVHNKVKLAAALALALIATSCQSNVIHNGNETSLLNEKQTDTANTSLLTGDSPQKNYKPSGDGETTEPNAETFSPGYQGGTSAESNVLSDGGKTKDTDKPKTSEPQWNSSKPLILGLAVGDLRSKVTEQFGDYIDRYKLEDEKESIEVYEYKGFAVGINEKNTIQYVEVYDGAVSTGISGIRVGDKSEKAVQALGKPQTQNSYILTYLGKGTLLKFDLDPEKSKIVSIKLIAHSEE
ncbi:hypothetical protein [Paenibacillus sp. NEAU-GSW1]|uniref:hypothetical protein n=1 Tax=Paenibacillus sp. NEAU-GSW1 TaxID=2682486 RepID=UPI0012E12B03|nr:hypothetical protein [Paenibacillus sp. NEAU-GSW1]MUT66261.1 hypothetical protein [Paenibacillus sp. NEAU-GSW1]